MNNSKNKNFFKWLVTPNKDIENLSAKTLEKINKFYREKAITATKTELKMRQKEMTDFSDEDIEEIISEKEKEIRSKHKMTAVKLALIPLGFGWFIN